MRFVFSALVYSILFLNCGDHINSPATGLRVSDPDHLYFKNVRVNLYSAIEDNELHLTRYTHRKFMDVDSPVRLVLIDNWIHGLAYLEVQTEAGIATGAVFKIGPQSSVNYAAEGLEDREALRALKNDLAGNTSICFPKNNTMEEYCFPVGSPVREALRVTIMDFLKLTTLETGRSSR